MKKLLYIALPLTAVIAVGWAHAASLSSAGEQVYYNILSPKRVFIRNWRLNALIQIEVVNPGNATIRLQSVFLRFLFKDIKIAEITQQLVDGKISPGRKKEFSLNLAVPIVDTIINVLFNLLSIFSGGRKEVKVMGKIVANGFDIAVAETYDLTFKQEENERESA